MNKMVKTSIAFVILVAAGYYASNYINVEKNIEESDIPRNKEQSTVNPIVTNPENEIRKKKTLEAKANTKISEIEIECTECDENGETNDVNQEMSQLKRSPISSKDISIVEEIKELSIDESFAIIQDLVENEPINTQWAVEAEENINGIFRDSKNFDILSESDLDYTDSECRTTICSVNFIPTKTLDPMGRMRQMLALTSFFEQDQDLDDAQMHTNYTDDGRLIVTLLFKKKD